MKLYTFRKGGIHPGNYKLTADAPIKTAEIPAQVAIPLSQHTGTPAQPVVQKGDRVKVGTLLASAGEGISAPVHSSVSGKVNRFDMQMDTSGYKRPVVVIDVEGDKWEEAIDTSSTLIKEYRLTAEEILQKIEQAGIVGMGGAAFPIHIKLKPPKGAKAEVLLINGAECEPYLTADYRIMIEKSEELIVGVELLMKASGANKAFIAIEDNKPAAIKKLRELTRNNPFIEIAALKTKYPQGGEKQLICAVLHKRIRSGALPISVGAIVQNAGTAIAVYEAVQKNKPSIERIVTVTGKELKKGGNYLVRIGTPFQHLIDLAGGIPEGTGKIISGGPMMGKAVYDTSVVVTKGTSGIVLLPGKESARKKAAECIRCAKCLEVCAMRLNPSRLMTLSEFKEWDKAEKEMIADCIECGSCSYICPATRPLLDYIRLGKRTVINNTRNRRK